MAYRDEVICPSHRAIKCYSWDLHPGSLAPEPAYITMALYCPHSPWWQALTSLGCPFAKLMSTNSHVCKAVSIILLFLIR